MCFSPLNNLVGNLSSFSKKKKKKVCVVYWSWIFFSTISSSLRTFYHGFCQGQRMIMLDFFPLAYRDRRKPYFPPLAKAEYLRVFFFLKLWHCVLLLSNFIYDKEQVMMVHLWFLFFRIFVFLIYPRMTQKIYHMKLLL